MEINDISPALPRNQYDAEDVKSHKRALLADLRAWFETVGMPEPGVVTVRAAWDSFAGSGWAAARATWIHEGIEFVANIGQAGQTYVCLRRDEYTSAHSYISNRDQLSRALASVSQTT